MKKYDGTIRVAILAIMSSVIIILTLLILEHVTYRDIFTFQRVIKNKFETVEEIKFTSGRHTQIIQFKLSKDGTTKDAEKIYSEFLLYLKEKSFKEQIIKKYEGRRFGELGCIEVRVYYGDNQQSSFILTDLKN